MKQFKLGSRYYFMRLTDSEKRVYRAIYDLWVKGGSVAKLCLPGSGFTLPTGMKLHQLVTYIIDENPHLFHLETSHFLYERCGEWVTIQADNVYSREEYECIYAELIIKVDQICELARQYNTDYERFRFLHDYLAMNIVYDKGVPDSRSQRESHTIVGALLMRACVCDGYARAYRLLCDQLHLSCIVAIGESTVPGAEGPHAWNYVKLDKKVYHVDVTWDSNLYNKDCPIMDYYFMRKDAIFQKTHAWDKGLYSAIYEDYPRKECYASDKRELERYICGELESGNTDIVVQFSEDFPGAVVLNGLLQRIAERNPTVFSPVCGYDSCYIDSLKCSHIVFFMKENN